MRHGWTMLTVVGILAAVSGRVTQTTGGVQPHGPYARIAIMRALNESHTVDLEALVTCAIWNGTGRPKTRSIGTAIRCGHRRNASDGSFMQPLATRQPN